MGFDLRSFFELLEWIIAEGYDDQTRMIDRLRQEIKDNKQYAKDCGQLSPEPPND